MIESSIAVSELEFIVEKIESCHFSPFHRTSESDFAKHKSRLLEHWNSSEEIPLREFIRSSMQLVSELSNGHTQIYWLNPMLEQEVKEFQFLPIRVQLDSEDKVITTGSLKDWVPKGSVIRSINGLDASQLFRETMDCCGGIDGFRKVFATQFLPIYLYLKGVNAPYQVELSSKQTISHQGVDIQSFNEFIYTDSTEPYEFKVLENDIAYIGYHACEDEDAFEEFLTKSFARIKNEKPEKLIVDIRENTGGNSALNDHLIGYLSRKEYRQSSGRIWKVSSDMKRQMSNALYAKYFGQAFVDKYRGRPDGSVIKEFDFGLESPPEKEWLYTGKSCFLIGPKTFSSANFLADAVATYDLSTLIGLPTGEYTNDFGEQLQLTSPKTKTDFFVGTTYDIGADGNPDTKSPVNPDIQVQGDALRHAIQWLNGQKE